MIRRGLIEGDKAWHEMNAKEPPPPPPREPDIEMAPGLGSSPMLGLMLIAAGVVVLLYAFLSGGPQ